MNPYKSVIVKFSLSVTKISQFFLGVVLENHLIKKWFSCWLLAIYRQIIMSDGEKIAQLQEENVSKLLFVLASILNYDGDLVVQQLFYWLVIIHDDPSGGWF